MNHFTANPYEREVNAPLSPRLCATCANYSTDDELCNAPTDLKKAIKMSFGMVVDEMSVQAFKGGCNFWQESAKMLCPETRAEALAKLDPAA